MSEFTNSYHNKAQNNANARPEFIEFFEAADLLLEHAAELARIVTQAHQSAAVLISDGDWSRNRKYFSLSEKYANWADYATPATGYGIHKYITEVNQTFRLTETELENHPQWKHFGTEDGKHPPMRGWLAMPLTGSDGLNYGVLQVSDRYEGDFTQEDEGNLARLVKLTSTALDALALVYVPGYREKVEQLKQNSTSEN